MQISVMKMPSSRQKPLETHFYNFPGSIYDFIKNGKFDKTLELTEWCTVDVILQNKQGKSMQKEGRH